MMKHFRHMAIFARIVECGSISAASSELNISKSVVSQQLKSLEQELGVPLLNRTTRRQVLTPAGRDFYQHCMRIISIAQQAWTEARDTQQLAVGSVSISTPHALVDSIVAPAIGELITKHHRINPTILADDQRVNLIEDGIDLAIRVGEMPSSDYKQLLIGHFTEVLCASPQYLKQRKLTQELLTDDDPTGRSACDYIANAWQGSHVRHRCIHKKTGKYVELSFSPNRFCNTLSSVLAMAKSGAGLALIPDFLFNPCQKQSALENALPEYSFTPVPVYAIHAFGSRPPTLVRLCIDAIKQKIQP